MLENLSFSLGSSVFILVRWMIKGRRNLKVRSILAGAICPWLSTAPPHYGKQAELHRSVGTVNVPSARSPSSSLIKEIHLCLREDTQVTPRRTNSSCALAEDELIIYCQAVPEQQLYFYFLWCDLNLGGGGDPELCSPIHTPPELVTRPRDSVCFSSCGNIKFSRQACTNHTFK